MKHLLTILITLVFTVSFAQKEFIGKVTNNQGKPVEQAAITVALLNTEDRVETIVVTDENGAFNFQVSSKAIYVINVSHISYAKQRVQFDTSKLSELNVILESDTQNLDEIIITHVKPKVRIKNDTTSFALSKYIDDNDRKLKDLVEKLPGITLNKDGSIFFKGEKVAKLLVENEDFFGGGTKLGLDNIPADAIEKLEIIANYSKSNLLKNSRRTNQQVINLVLKKNRKSIVFGNANVASNFSDFYKTHGALFQFKKKRQTNFILDANNIGEQGIGFNEADALANIDAELFRLNKPNFYSFADDLEFASIKNQTFAGNVKFIKEQSTWDVLGLYTSSKTERKSTQNQLFLNNDSFDNTDNINKKDTASLYLRASNNFQSKSKERLVAAVISLTNTKVLSQTISISNLGNRNFSENGNEQVLDYSLLFEEVRLINKNTKLVYGAKTELLNTDDAHQLNANEIFLEQQIPWINQNEFRRFKDYDQRDFEVGLRSKIFYNISASSILEFGLSYNHINSQRDALQNQILDDNSTNDFGGAFNSDANLNRNEVVSKLSYTLNAKKWFVSAGTELGFYNLNFQNQFNEASLNKGIFNPFLKLQYSINEKKSFVFSYNNFVEYPEIFQLDDLNVISSYTTIFQGNAGLNNSKTQDFSLRYSDYNIPKNYSFSSSNSFRLNDRALRTVYNFNDINQFRNYFYQNNVGHTFNSRNKLFFLLNKWSVGVSVNYRATKDNIQLETINTATNKRLSIAPKIEYRSDNLPDLKIEPYVRFNNQEFANSKRDFTATGISTEVDHNFTENIYTKVNYNYAEIDNEKALSRFNFEVRFTDKKDIFDVSLIGLNVFANQLNTNIFQTPLYRLEETTEILGRRILLSLAYNF